MKKYLPIFMVGLSLLPVLESNNGLSIDYAPYRSKDGCVLLNYINILSLYSKGNRSFWWCVSDKREEALLGENLNLKENELSHLLQL